MTEEVQYVAAAVLVFHEDRADLVQPAVDNGQGVPVTPVALADFLEKPAEHVSADSHVVVAAPTEALKSILELAREIGFSIGVLRSGHEKGIAGYLDLPADPAAAMELALRQNDQPMDLVRCNGEIVLVKAVVGWVPALDAQADAGFFGTLYRTFRRLLTMRPQPYTITTASGQVIRTAASGCMVTEPHRGDVATRLVGDQTSFRDGAATLIITSPFSLAGYLKFLGQVFLPGGNSRRLPNGTGFIKSPSLAIECNPPARVVVDGYREMSTPLEVECVPRCVRLNVGPRVEKESGSSEVVDKDTIKVDALPDEKEAAKSAGRRVPMFSYASEERFRDLFTSLRADARIDSIFVVLMLLSTLIAAIGLYLDSAAVIIGAMVLAPLMAPIVSMAMGILRANVSLIRDSAKKILAGVIIALLASALLSVIFAFKPVTGEMQGRLSPSLLDLGVAILSGIAGAYAKSYKEILQSLAGVAIAVALVPPLAVAGIGLGRLDFVFFTQAFLLFLTNLVGIVVAATLTFRVLGFSPAVRGRRSFVAVSLSLAAIAVPLYLTYDDIVQRSLFEQRMAQDRFLLNGKYVMVTGATLGRQAGGEKLLIVELLAREPLDRADLTELRHKILLYFEEDLQVQTEIRYAL
ncbi:MAG: TIGR00341 family protein [Gammaproteobacteria bacterium]